MNVIDLSFQRLIFISLHNEEYQLTICLYQLEALIAVNLSSNE